MFIDVHCHADLFDNIENEIKAAKDANVGILISNSINLESMEKNMELAAKNKEIKILLGVHPQEVINMSEKEIDESFEFIEKNIKYCIGIGETGLDYKYSKTDKQKRLQKKCFNRHIELAANYDLPIEVHSRRAQEDVLRMLEKSCLKKVVLHWFYGNSKLVNKAIELGYFISVGPAVISNGSLRTMVEKYPLSRILFETDCPAVLFDGKRVNSAAIVKVAEKVSAIKNIGIRHLEEITEQNACRLFNMELNKY